MSQTESMFDDDENLPAEVLDIAKDLTDLSVRSIEFMADKETQGPVMALVRAWLRNLALVVAIPGGEPMPQACFVDLISMLSMALMELEDDWDDEDDEAIQ